MKNIIFIGGIHGSGKGTICRYLASRSSLIHITASEIINWETSSKNVENIKNTQEKLIKGLENLIEENKEYLLDGHFCLFNTSGEINKVPLNTFKSINPRTIIVVVCDVATIKERLEMRDSIIYDIETLIKMQNTEIEHAKFVAKNLGIPYLEYDQEKTDYLMREN